jgi:hypothetical protein
LEQGEDAELKRLLEQERRELLIGHLVSEERPTARSSPKGVVIEDSLPFLTEEDRATIFNKSLKPPFMGCNSRTDESILRSCLRWERDILEKERNILLVMKYSRPKAFSE